MQQGWIHEPVARDDRLQDVDRLEADRAATMLGREQLVAVVQRDPGLARRSHRPVLLAEHAGLHGRRIAPFALSAPSSAQPAPELVEGDPLAVLGGLALAGWERRQAFGARRGREALAI